MERKRADGGRGGEGGIGRWCGSRTGFGGVLAALCLKTAWIQGGRGVCQTGRLHMALLLVGVSKS